MKLRNRILSLVCAILMLLSVAACANTNDPEDTTEAPSAETTAPQGPAETTADLYDEEGYLKDDLPELNFGDTINFIWWTDVENLEFYVEEENADPIGDAIFKRNATVEQRLGVEIEWIEQKGQFNNGVGQAYCNFVGNQYASGETEIDVMTAHTRTIALCSQKGYCVDLLELEYLDFEKPWWPKDLVETATIGDELYYVTGDCSTNALHMMYTIFYNKDIMENNKIDDPAQMVLDDTWTIDEFHRITKGLYQDLDQDGAVTKGDAFGFTTLNWHLDGIYYGADMILVENDPEKLLKISPDYSSEKAVNLASKMYEWISTERIYTSSSHTEPYMNGNAFMTIGRNSDVMKKVDDIDFKYGIVPCPKYDINQESYRTALGNPTSFYSVYALADDPNMVAAFLECWASEGYRNTTPAVFEQTMKLRYSETSVESEMYDKMRGGIVFDVGRYYNGQLANMSDNWDNACISGQNWKVVVKQYEKAINKALTNIATAYQTIQAD